MEQYKDCKILDPACGNDAIVDFLRQHGFNAVGTDLFTKPEHINFLTDPIDQTIDFLILNPPFNRKKEFIMRAYLSGLPFLMLLPLACIATVGMAKILSTRGVVFYVLVGQQKFFLTGENRWVSVGECVWLAGNLPDSEPFTQTFITNFIGRDLLDTSAADEPFSQESDDGTLYDTYEDEEGITREISNPIYGPTDADDYAVDTAADAAADAASAELGFGITCPVCFDSLSDETGCVLAYNCGHPLCNQCYDNWRKAKGAICPVCRALDVVRRGRGRPRSSA